jgi:hypothetical protein
VAADRPRTGSVVEVLTDRAGRFRFPGVAPGGAALEVLFEEEIARKRAAAPFEVEPGKTYVVPLTFGDGR